ncbi:MAG: release factor glutamine methyltransferase [Acidimicrobiaceae bacterium]|nr:release factor glutamine methyltransferase [Acidimicrobiaceae bacterium]
MATEPSRRQLVEAATSRLGSGPEARWIVEDALARDGSAIDGPLLGRSLSALGLDEPVPPSVSRRVASLVSRRQAGEPLQYILGRWPFRTIELAVDRRVLIPRPETEQVVEVALAELLRATADRIDTPARAQPLVAVDLGTGSGAIALSLAVEGGGARHAGLDVWATDSSLDALDVARANLKSLQAVRSAPAVPVGEEVPDATAVAPATEHDPLDRVRLVQGVWFAALPPSLMGTIDLVVSNPPYVSAAEYPELDLVVRDWEPETALVAGSASDGSAGLADIETIIADASRWLTSRGAVVIELAPHQGEAALSMAQRSGFADARVEPDLAGRPRVLVAARR